MPRPGERKFLDAGPVQSDLETARLTDAADNVAADSLQDDLDDVLTVGGEMVVNRQTAARSERQIFARAILLRVVERHSILRHVRADRGICDGQPSDAARGDKIPIQQARRDREHVRDVVESVSRVVGRQIRARIDADAQKVANGVCIFRAVQPVHAWPARVRRARRHLVERRFEPVRHCVVASLVGTTGSRGRHRAGAEPANNFFPGVSMLTDHARIQPVQLEAGGLQPLVVTRDAIPIEQRPDLGRAGPRRRRGLRTGGSGA